MKKSSSKSNLDRKTIEKNRRIHMKGLCLKLSSIIPQHHYSSCSKDMLSQLEQLDHATSYIKKLESRLEELKMRKKQLMAMNNVNCRATATSSSTTTRTAGDVHNNNHHLLSSIMNSSSIQSRTMVDNGLISSSCSSSLLPVLELRDMGSTLEVILISGLNKNFMFYQIITVLEEEGAQVVNASFSTVGDKIFHTIHSQVINSRVGVETSRVCDRLKDLVNPLRS